MTDNPVGEAPFLNVPSELPFPHVLSLRGISTFLSTATLEGVLDCAEIFPQPAPLQAEQNKCPQLLFISLGPEAFLYFGHPALHTL